MVCKIFLKHSEKRPELSVEEYIGESQTKKGREAHFLQREKPVSRYMVRGVDCWQLSASPYRHCEPVNEEEILGGCW